MLIRYFVLIAVAASWSIAPALAEPTTERPMVRTKHLPQVEFYHSRPQVEIDDTSPIYSDWRKQPSSETIVVPMSVMQKPQHQQKGLPSAAFPIGNNVYVIPDNSGAPRSNGNPMIGNRALAPAGPTSHINPFQAIPNNLPAGATTGIHSKMQPLAGAGTGGNGSPRTSGGNPFATKAAPAAPATMKYQGAQQSVGASSSTQVQTNTAVRLLNKMR